MGTTLIRLAVAGGVVAFGTATAACDPSRDERDAEGVVATVRVNPPTIADGSREGGTVTTDPTFGPDEEPADEDGDSSLEFPYPDYFDVESLGTEPVRGSGCGVDTFIGDELPDGLWRGFVRSFDGLWVDGSTSLEFDLACVYAEDAAVVARQRWVAEHPGESPVELPDGFLVNNNERVRTVPLASTFVQTDAQWNEAERCLPPEDLRPSGSTQVYKLLDSWLLVDDGEAQWVLTSCVGS